MGSQNHFHPRLVLDFLDQGIPMRTMIGDAGTEMNLGDLFLHRFVPQIELCQPRHDGRTRTVPTVQEADDCGIAFRVAIELAGFAVEFSRRAWWNSR